ncbi:MAG: transporter substrate-binding domain-containing protein [Pseudomonadota bacterium]
MSVTALLPMLARLRASLLPAALALLTVAGPGHAQEVPQAAGAEDGQRSAPLVIATREAPPFALRDGNGEWEGITVALLRELSTTLAFDFELVEMDLTQMLDAVQAGEVDAAASAITITAERESAVDFTHPFYSSGLGIAVPRKSSGSLFSALGRFGSLAFLEAALALLALLTVVGVIVWLAERRRNDQFPESPLEGVASGIWWSATTMTTVGYGDKAPATLPGRVVGLIWMFASIIIISGFTAAIATALTVDRLENTISGIDDLQGRRVITVTGSTSAAYLDDHLIRHRTRPAVEDAIAALAAGEADAVVYDMPILRYLAATQANDTVRVLPNQFAHQDYGIALPNGSPLREAINQEILRHTRSAEWERLLATYLGED